MRNKANIGTAGCGLAAMTVVFVVWTAGCGGRPTHAEQQSQQPTPSAAPDPRAQPGTKWTEDQIKKAVAAVRAGRKLTPKAWPNGAKVAVCLSFDIDNESPLLARGNTLPVPVSETEYGATEGLGRILEFLDGAGIPGSFYIPAVSLVLHPEMTAAIQKSGRHEIGVHGWIHENLPDLNNRSEEQRLLSQAIDHLTKATGKRPAGYRAPSWAFSEYTWDLVRSAGFQYDSSMMAMDQPYQVVTNGQPTNVIELPVTWIQDDAPYFGRTGALPSPELIFQVYRDEFDVAYREGTMLMLTFHPHVSGHRSRMVHLEKLVSYMKSKSGVWFATAEQIAEHVKRTSGLTATN